MKQFFIFLFAGAILLSAQAYSQVTVTSSDTLSCTNLCTTLTAHVIGDVPINSGITDDDVFAPVPNPIGFTFYFYGTGYYSCLIGPNGNISFDTADVGMSTDWEITAPLLGNPTVYNTICGPWEDIYIPAGGTITYSTDGVPGSRKYVITYCHTAMYSCTTQYTTSQIILYETSNIIEVHLTHKDICTGWNPDGGTDGGRGIIGVQNATGSDATAAPGRDWVPVWSATDEAWRFSPYVTASGAVSYTVASIPYAPIPYDSSSIYWYNASTGAYLGTGDSIVVCPTSSTTYKAGSLGCADTSYGYYTVTPTAALISAIASTSNPSKCGACDGNIVVNGLTPGTVDTVNYDFGGAAQPTVIATANSGGTITLTGLCAGAYTNITVKQATCLSAPLSVSLDNPGISISSLTPTNVTSCGGTDGSLVLNGLYPDQAFTVNYTLNGLVQPPVAATSSATGTITLTGLTVGVYANIIASFGACATPPAGPITLTGPPPPDIPLTSFTNPTQCGYCDGTIQIQYIAPYSSDTVFLSINGVAQPPFLNIAQPDGTVLIPGLCVGDYSSITVKVGPCPSTVIGEAVLTAPPIIDSFSFVNHYGCKGDTVLFTNKSSSSGPLYYIWNYGDATYTDTATNPQHIFRQGIYTITLTADNHVCDTTFSLTDSLVHPLQASFVDTPVIYCQDVPVMLINTSALLSAGAITYEWLFGDGQKDTTTNTVHTYPKAGTYDVQLIATNFIPCHDTASLLVSIDSNTAIGLTVTDSVICRSSSITFTGAYTSIGNTGVTWYFGDGDSVTNVNPVIHSYDAPGTYTVTASPHYRVCRDTSISKEFRIYAAPTIYLGPDTSICAGSEALSLTDYNNATNPLATWKWNTGATTPGITVVEPGYYSATVSIDGCTATDTVWVTNDCYMNIPNVFTPNGDGLNDYFYPLQELASGLVTYKMDIYNRWGQLVFEGTALDGRGWDGKFNGVDQPEGVYIYVMDATFKDGQKQHHQGNVTLLR